MNNDSYVHKFTKKGENMEKENNYEEPKDEKTLEILNEKRESNANLQKKEDDYELPDEEALVNMAEFFSIFADSTRIKILYILLQSEKSVGEIWQTLGLTQSAVSHQLRILKQMRLVKYRKEGKTIFYSLSDGHIKSILYQGLEHVME